MAIECLIFMEGRKKEEGVKKVGGEECVKQGGRKELALTMTFPLELNSLLKF